MTRYKKYVREKGFKLEEDYPAIPWPIGNSHVTIQAVNVSVSDNEIFIREYYDTICQYSCIDRHGNITTFDDFDF